LSLDPNVNVVKSCLNGWSLDNALQLLMDLGQGVNVWSGTYTRLLTTRCYTPSGACTPRPACQDGVLPGRWSRTPLSTLGEVQVRRAFAQPVVGCASSMPALQAAVR
jgi:hypothetical protein